MKAIDRSLVVEVDKENQPENNTRDKDASDSSDDDDLFDNLRKLRDNYTTESNEVVSTSNKPRKRTRSVEMQNDNSKSKIQKIDEEQSENSDDNDILSFAKKTLEYNGELQIDTEDILGDNPRLEGMLTCVSNIS